MRLPPAALFALAAAASLLPSSAAAECLNIDDPLQVLDLHLAIDPTDWSTILHDTSFSIERPATFRCGDEPPLLVMVRQKPTFPIPDSGTPVKVSLKIDFDDRVLEQEWHSHRKLSLENGAGGLLIREGMAWLLMGRAGAVAGNAAWVRLIVNGEPVGVYTRVEQIDKSYLRRHLNEDEYFLYDEGTLETREGEVDPFAAALCYEPFDNDCPLPADGYASLHEDLNVPVLLTMAAVNAFAVNPDGLLAKQNNHFWYNSPQPRFYFPWDLDTVLPRSGGTDVDPHSVGRNSDWETLLLGDARLRSIFDTILLRLIGDPFHPASVDRLIDDLIRTVAPVIETDVWNDLQSSAQQEFEFVRSWLHDRVSRLGPMLPPGDPFPVVINEIMASNASTIQDEAGEYADWVELYNRGAATVSLDGLHLSDLPGRARRWAFPPGVAIPPGGHLLVWCDNDVLQGPLHTGFRLNASGDTIGLYASNSDLNRALDFVWFGPQRTDVSIGRAPDGSPDVQTSVRATPGGANAILTAGPGEVGPTLGIELASESTLTLRWQQSCSSSVQDYALYEGEIGRWSSHAAIDCQDDLGDRAEQVTISPGSRYYLVVPLAGGAEGSYGKSSGGQERPRGTLVCAPAQIVDSCLP